MNNPVRGCLSVGLLAFSAGVSLPAEARVPGHRAVYSLTAGEGSKSIDAAEGRYVFDLEDLCDGYTLNERLVVRTMQLGAEILTDYRHSAFEAEDGSLYRFASGTTHNGAPASEAEGTLNVGAEGSEINFKSADDLTFDEALLPPLAHLRSVLEAAKAGEVRHAAKVFDGDVDKPVFLVISRLKETQSPPPSAEGADALADLRHWHIDSVYYPVGSEQGSDAVPDFSFTGTLHENGVMTGLELDYGDFSLDAALEELTVYEDTCN